MKTILTLASTGMFIRNFVSTDAQGLLAYVGVRTVVLAPKEKLAYYRAEYGDDFLQFEELPPLKKMARERIFQFLENASIHTRTTAMLQQTKFRRFKSSGYWLARFIVYMWARTCWFLGQFAWWRNCIRRVYAQAPNHAFDSLIETYKPDLIFCPSMFYTEDYVLLKAAKRHRIPTVGMVLSWDNFYSKTFLRVYPDRLIVHTDAIRDLAVRYGDYPAARISVTGVPQYDRHFRSIAAQSREDFIRALGGSKRVRSPMSAPIVMATVHCTPRKAWRASTTGCKRQVVACSRRSWSRRPRRSGCSVTVRTYAGKTLGGAGVGQTTAARHRRWAGPPLARPAERISWRSTKALSRHWASLRSLITSSRARVRSRIASSSTVGTYTGVRSPERARRASCIASRRSVLTRTPACWGISDGATTQPSSSFFCR